MLVPELVPVLVPVLVPELVPVLVPVFVPVVELPQVVLNGKFTRIPVKSVQSRSFSSPHWTTEAHASRVASHADWQGNWKTLLGRHFGK